MKYMTLLIAALSMTICNLIPHQYKSSDELVANFLDVRAFQFDGTF